MGKAYLRAVERSDVDLLFEWANDSEVRLYSFNTADIKFEEHQQWFENCMLDTDVDIYIYYIDDEPVGQIRLNYNDETGVISYSIAKNFRGQGYGTILLKLIEAELVSARPNIKFLSGSVKPDNIASQRIFEDNDYEKELIDGNNEYIIYNKKIEYVKAIKDVFADMENMGWTPNNNRMR